MKTDKIYRVLYVGAFKLPDKNAAAQRVVSNAKLLELFDAKVSFMQENPKEDYVNLATFNYEVYQFTNSKTRISKYKRYLQIKNIQKIIDQSIQERNKIDMIIAYNYPSFQLFKLAKICKRYEIKLVSDVTEWYGNAGKKGFKRIIKKMDTFVRMRIINPRLDGLILISNSLSSFYLKYDVPQLILPPLVDKDDVKWEVKTREHGNSFRFVYAGSPSREKERLDIIITELDKIRKKFNIQFDIVGITKSEYEIIYSEKLNNEIDTWCFFHGKKSHIETIEIVKKSNYSIIVRDNNRVTKMGFPTKFVESVSCCVPVITNSNSDLSTHIDNCGYLVDENNLSLDIINILEKNPSIDLDSNKYDYRKYEDDVEKFLKKVC